MTLLMKSWSWRHPSQRGHRTNALKSFIHNYIHVFLTLSNPMSDLVRHYDFPVPDAFPHVVRTLANR
jgi:hypothetical protein